MFNTSSAALSLPLLMPLPSTTADVEVPLRTFASTGAPSTSPMSSEAGTVDVEFRSHFTLPVPNEAGVVTSSAYTPLPPRPSVPTRMFLVPSGLRLRELTAMQLFGAIDYPAAGAAVAAAALFFAANVLPALLLLPVVAAMARRRA